jgi:hypothetical protein
MKNIFTKLACSFVLLSIAGTANAITIVQQYTVAEGDGVSGGEITYADLGGNQFQISIDNITTGTLQSVITGLVFDVAADINTAGFTIVDGFGNDISGTWNIGFNTDGNITPGKTVVDLYFDNDPGINGGIYNSENPPGNITNLYSDIAIITLNVTSPIPWALEAGGISMDKLRLQQSGSDGEGSLKLDPGENEPPAGVPVPGTLLLLGLGLVGLAGSRRRNS